jgi:hypothetical protein
MKSTIERSVGARLCVAIVVVLAWTARADAEAYLRVIAQKTPIHSGPGVGYRVVAYGERNQVFQVLERGTNGYWFKIELEDGTTGWIVGDAVYPFEVGPEEPPGVFTRMGRAIKGAILGPSPVAYSNAGLAFAAGYFENEGVFMLRPSWLIDPYWALEGFVGLSPGGSTDVYLTGLGFVLRLAPGAVITPYAALNLGWAHISPHADNFVDPRENDLALGAGGGFEITLKKQITLRLEALQWSLFTQNHAHDGQEYTGGLAIFF